MSFSFTLTRKFCVYVDWTTESVPRPYYVGKGNRHRVNHLPRNVVHNHIAEKYGHHRTIVFETDDPVEAFDLETRLVAEYKTYARGGEGWWGANLTKGGEGKRGGTKMPSHSETMKRLWQDATYRKNVLTAREGSYRVSNKHKAHLSQCASERWNDPTFRERMSKTPRRCRKCHQPGHYATTCPSFLTN